jgi:hypothetical protein
VSAILVPVTSSQNAPPVCLFENSTRLVSLLDMYRIAAEKLVQAGRALQQMQSQLVALVAPQSKFTGDALALFIENLSTMKDNCDSVGMNGTGDMLAWIIDDYQQTPHNHGQARSSAEYVTAMFEQELSRNLFCFIEPEKAKYFRSVEQFLSDPPFGRQVLDAFPAAARDIGLAGNSYACGFDDACVFHLMMVLEKGLAALAGQVSLSNLSSGVIFRYLCCIPAASVLPLRHPKKQAAHGQNADRQFSPVESVCRIEIARNSPVMVVANARPEIAQVQMQPKMRCDQ